MKILDVAWSDTMSIDITSLDNEHKILAQKFELFKLCSQTHEPMETLLNLFDDLIDSIRSHFAHEELILKNISYPGLLQHAKVHTAVLKKVVKHRDILSNSPNDDALQKTLLFLDGSIGGHLSVEDGKIRDFIHSGE